MAELAAFSAIVHGRVQGVFFRSFVREQASILGLTGYVRNLPSGREVEVYAEGEREKLEQLVKQLHIGPRWAKVDKVEINWSEYTGRFDTFNIRY